MGQCCYNWFHTYRAQKFVSVKSRKIAIPYRILQVSVILYIVVWTILVRNKHLLPVRMDGSVRMTMQQPTNGCNPMHADCKSDYMPMSSLPYCTVYESYQNRSIKPMSFVPWSAAQNANASNLKQHGLQHKCVYKDNINMTFPFPVPGALFLQTRASVLPQHQQCSPNAANRWSCSGALFKMKSNSAQSDYYIAEIERFTLMFDHGYRVQLPNKPREQFGHAHQFKGFVQDLDGKSVEMPSAKQFFGKKKRSKKYPSLFTTGSGDIISLGDLLRLADKRGEAMMDIIELGKHKNKTRRWNGGVLHISIHYDGEHTMNPLGLSKITYTLSAELLPQKEFKNMYAEDVKNGHRMVYDMHGFLVVATVHGSAYVFDLVYLFQVLTTSVAMLAVAKFMVDNCMNGCMTESPHYRALQNQSSINFDAVDKEEDAFVHDDNRYMSLKVGGAHDKTAAYLMDQAAQSNTPLEGEDLLYVLLKFEQRLNSLDGLDHTFVCGKPLDTQGASVKACKFAEMTEDRMQKVKDNRVKDNRVPQNGSQNASDVGGNTLMSCCSRRGQ